MVVLAAMSVAVLVSPAEASPQGQTPSSAGQGVRASSATKASDDKRAVELFEESAAAYRAGDFAKAIDRLKQAYALKPAPVLIYNLARVYEGAGQVVDALSAYREYLAKEPNAADRGAIEKRISTLQGQVDERERAKREAEQRAAAGGQPASATPVGDAEQSDKSSGASPIPWVLGGVGVAAAATAGVLLVMSKSRHDDAVKEPVQTTALDLSKSSSTLSTAGTITMVAGGAMVAAGVVWLLATPARKDGAPAKASALVAPTVSKGGVGASLQVAW